MGGESKQWKKIRVPLRRVGGGATTEPTNCDSVVYSNRLVHCGIGRYMNAKMARSR